MRAVGKFLSFRDARFKQDILLVCERSIPYRFGAVAEWLRRGLQSLAHRFDSGPRLQYPVFDPA
jgi:hypothetical protein